MTEISLSDGVWGSHQYAASAPSTSPLLTRGTDSTARYPSRSTVARVVALSDTSGSFRMSALHTARRCWAARPVVPSPSRTRSELRNPSESPRPRS